MDDVRRLLGAVSAAVFAALAVAAGCTTPYKVGTTATSFMNVIRTDPNPNVRHVAYSKLANPKAFDDDAQRDEAAKLLTKSILDGKEPTASRAVICRTLGEMRRPIGREALLKGVDDVDDLVRTEACRALGKIGKPEDATILARIMATDSGCKDCQIAAIEGIGLLKSSDPRIELVLVEGMESEDPAIRLASVKAIRDSTGKDLGIEPGPWRKEAQERIDAMNVAKSSPNGPAPPAEVANGSKASKKDDISVLRSKVWPGQMR